MRYQSLASSVRCGFSPTGRRVGPVVGWSPSASASGGELLAGSRDGWSLSGTAVSSGERSSEGSPASSDGVADGACGDSADDADVAGPGSSCLLNGEGSTPVPAATATPPTMQAASAAATPNRTGRPQRVGCGRAPARARRTVSPAAASWAEVAYGAVRDVIRVRCGAFARAARKAANAAASPGSSPGSVADSARAVSARGASAKAASRKAALAPPGVVAGSGAAPSAAAVPSADSAPSAWASRSACART